VATLLEDLVRRATEKLRGREAARDEVLGRARRARMLSKQAILLIHNDAKVKAAANLEDARRLFEETRPHVEHYPELNHYEEVEAALEEYAEAAILLGLETKSAYPEPEDIGVGLTSYLLGLCDVPGELRREALDELRTGDFEAAEAYLRRMEEIYLNLVSVEEASLLLRGLRRKLDIARGVIENTRAELTAEAGRRRLNESVSRLSERLREP
jgi:translin